MVGTPSVMNIEAAIYDADIMVGDPWDWPILPVGLEKRICISFDECLVFLYECM